MCGNRRGFRRWSWVIPVFLPIAAALLANLWLASPFGRDWIAAKIQRRAGLECHVGGASMWPWSGVSLRQVELLQPAALRSSVNKPFVRIATIRLHPVWRAWLRGKPALRGLELDSPRFSVPVEWLAERVKSQAPVLSAGPPLAATTAPALGPVTPSPASPATSPQEPAGPPEAPVIALPPTAWLHLKNASLAVISSPSGESWFEVSGVSGSIPVAGRAAVSTLRVRVIQAAGEEFLTDLRASLDWTPPLVSLKPLETEIHGLKFMFAGKLGLLGGLPLQIDARLPRQAPALIALPDHGRIGADSIIARARFRGFLLAPATWQGDLLAEASRPAVRLAGHDAQFDRGHVVSALRGGVLSCLDARLIGDELSVLGNATLLGDGRAAAAIRMVAAPETATAIARRWFPHTTHSLPLTPLSTPQRAAFDLEAYGNIRQLFLQLGRDGPVVEINR